MSWATDMLNEQAQCLPACTGCLRHHMQLRNYMPLTCQALRRYGLHEHSYRDDWGLQRLLGPSPEGMLR